jgi:hypothetical protein
MTCAHATSHSGIRSNQFLGCNLLSLSGNSTAQIGLDLSMESMPVRWISHSCDLVRAILLGFPCSEAVVYASLFCFLYPWHFFFCPVATRHLVRQTIEQRTRLYVPQLQRSLTKKSSLIVTSSTDAKVLLVMCSDGSTGWARWVVAHPEILEITNLTL